MATQTPRVKYELDAVGQIGVQHSNWDRADETAGIIYTTKAAGIPPVVKLYDGCVVSEKDTGISYRLFASENFTVKHYVNYPFCIRALGRQDIGVGTAGPGQGWANVDLANCVNYDDTWKDAQSRLVVKVKGIYQIRLHSWWNPGVMGHTWGTGSINQGYYRNNVLDNTKESTINIWPGYPNGVAALDMMFAQSFNANDVISHYTYNNNTTPTVRITLTIECALIRPLD
jgi:hypothetical protein